MTRPCRSCDDCVTRRNADVTWLWSDCDLTVTQLRPVATFSGRLVMRRSLLMKGGAGAGPLLRGGAVGGATLWDASDPLGVLQRV